MASRTDRQAAIIAGGLTEQEFSDLVDKIKAATDQATNGDFEIYADGVTCLHDRGWFWTSKKISVAKP